MSNTRDPVDGLVDYFLDVKPYHTKLLEVVVEYVHKELVNVTILDLMKSHLQIDIPHCPVFKIIGCPSSTQVTVGGDASFLKYEKLTLSNASVPDLLVFGVGNSVYASSNNTTTLTLNMNPGEDTSPFLFGFLRVHCSKPRACGDGWGTAPFGSDAIISPMGVEPLIPAIAPGGGILPISESAGVIVVHGNETGRLFAGAKIDVFLAILDDDGNEVWRDPAPHVRTVVTSTYSPGMIPGRTVPTDGSTLTLGTLPHTVVTTSDPFPTVPSVGPNENLIAYVRLRPLEVLDVLPYSPATEFVYGLDSVISAQYDNEPDESAHLNIGSNMFVIAGNHQAAFYQGRRFHIVGGLNPGTYLTLYADYVSGVTRIRTVEDIRRPGPGGTIRFWIPGYSETDHFCPSVPANEIRTTIRDRLVFSGIGFNFYEDIVAYNLENSDVYALEYPISTIRSTTEPVIVESATAPATPGENELWFDTDNGVMKQYRSGSWVKLQVAFWLDDDGQVWRYTRTSLYSSGWVRDFAGGFNARHPATALTWKIVGASPNLVTVIGDATAGLHSPIGPVAIRLNDMTQEVQVLGASYSSVTRRTSVILNSVDPTPFLGGFLVSHVSNAYVYPYNARPHQVFHPNVELDVVTGAIRLPGGNFADRFLSGELFSAMVNDAGFETTIEGLTPYRWRVHAFTSNSLTLNLPASVTDLMTTGTVLPVVSVTGAIEFVTVTGPTVAGVTPVTTLTYLPNVVIGAMFDPEGLGNPVTTIIPTVPLPNLPTLILRSIYYDWATPVSMRIDTRYSDASSTTIGDKTSMSNEAMIHGEQANLELNTAKTYILDDVRFDWGTEPVNWYQFNILSVTPLYEDPTHPLHITSGIIKIHGRSAQVSIQVGDKIQVRGITGMNGLFTVATAPTPIYPVNPPPVGAIPLTWEFKVAEEVVESLIPGGVVEPAVHNEIKITLSDTIGALVAENMDTSVATTGDTPFSFDSPGFDMNPFDTDESNPPY